ncbi:MBL fold metallo-hydrolase [Cohnella caldifontis]|uniref:MBL fold metallo-hydrolase n=1 Tax=Cohnella caldifontis TaxID=3027471 RepID=UPI0023EC7364|nr:MBL fold metallo-hydrolase [Cohnella sp. YIM B05605]
MIVRYIKSACVVVEHDNTKVLCDPWLTDGIYYGSWYHYPPLKFQAEDFRDVDYIYISHIHPDHLDTATLKRLPKHIPVLIASFNEKFVRSIIKECGFEHVVEINAGETFRLSEDFQMEILGADFCDPSICGKSFGCTLQTHRSTSLVDTLAVFHAGGKTVVNANDCAYPVTLSACDYIVQKYNTVDMLLTGYAGAGPYPQCYVYQDETEYLRRAENKKNQFLEQCVNYADHLKPKYFLPFAGQYTLGGKLAELNAYRGVPELEELDALLLPKLRSRGLFSRMVLLNSGESFDVEAEISSAPYTPINLVEKEKYIREVLSLKRFSYEEDPVPSENELLDMLRSAQAAMIDRLKKRDIQPWLHNWNVYISAGESEKMFRIPLNQLGVETVGLEEIQSPFLKVHIDPRLLRRILERKAHINNAEIGSHLRYERDPDEYDRALFVCLYYLHLS